MKDIVNFINEKANFIVKKHITKSTDFDPYGGDTKLKTNLNDFKDGDFFASHKYSGVGVQNQQIYGKFRSQYRGENGIEAYYFVTTANKIMFDKSCLRGIEKNGFVSKLTDEQIKILAEIDKHYDNGNYNEPDLMDKYGAGEIKDDGKIIWR